MSQSKESTADARGPPDDPTAATSDDEDPFTDEAVTSVLDEAWDDLQS